MPPSAELRRDSKPRRYELVVQEIQRLIQEGQLAPGDLLLPERQLAAALGVGRTAVREGLTALATQGVIAFGPSGPFVRELALDEAFHPLLASGFLSAEGVGHLLEVRKVLEAEAARLAALRGSPVRVRLLRDDVRSMERAIEAGESLHQVDMDFHVHVGEASENPLLAGITRAVFRVLGESFKPSREGMVSDAPKRQAFLEQHQTIVDAIESGDSEGARQAMYVHLAVVEREVAGF
jgi:GntR family transcriptional regulator, transcriptional repressor for pyruvate dehydrogenase complex